MAHRGKVSEPRAIHRQTPAAEPHEPIHPPTIHAPRWPNHSSRRSSVCWTDQCVGKRSSRADNHTKRRLHGESQTVIADAWGSTVPHLAGNARACECAYVKEWGVGPCPWRALRGCGGAAGGRAEESPESRDFDMSYGSGCDLPRLPSLCDFSLPRRFHPSFTHNFSSQR